MLLRCGRVRALAPVSRRWQSGVDGSAFSALMRSRKAVKRFQAEPVPLEVVQAVLEDTRRSPSSFNVQPWKCVIVRNDGVREAVASAMVKGNSARVREAPLTAVFLADLESYRLIPDLVRLERAAGAPEEYLKTLPPAVGLLASGGRFGAAANCAFSQLGSVVGGLPSVNDPQAWAFKNTMMAVQTFMLSATARGYATSPMEGFDEAAVRAAVEAPARYGVPAVVSMGLAQEDDWFAQRESSRFATSHLFCDGSFHQGWQGADAGPDGEDERGEK